MTARLEIVIPRSEHARPLSELFARIAIDPLSSRFHPHPFNMAEADRVCDHAGQDKYLALRLDERLIAYGLLRGWDEGFSVPSLGIYVEPEFHGSGAARLMMAHLHLTARLSGSQQIRLKVYSNNLPAYKLYVALGYDFSGPTDEGGQLVGVCHV